MTLQPAESAHDAMIGRPPNEPGTLRARKLSKEDLERLRVYEQIGEAVETAAAEFLRPFEIHPEAASGLRLLALNDSFSSFVSQANRFSDTCCQLLVKVIRSSTLIPSVRETPTPGLAKRIRDISFKHLDEILGHCAGSAKKIDVLAGNVRKILEAMENPASAPAPIEKIEPSGTGSPGEEEEWATQERLEYENARLLQAKTRAYAQIVEYFNGLLALPSTSVAYAADKCFGVDVSYEFQTEQIEELMKFMEPRLIMAIGAFERVASMEKGDLELAKAKIRSEKEHDNVHVALERALEEKLVQQEKTDRKSKKMMMWIFLLCFVVGLVAVLYFCIQAGLIQFRL
jgi:hypothetical protein